MHQGIGLDAFNELPTRKAVHALYECCNSVTMASDLAGGRPYPSHDALFRRADSLLFSLPEQAIDDILESYPKVGSRPGSARSHAEQCALWDEHPGVMKLLYSSARGYAEKFGFDFVMHLGDRSTASAVITATHSESWMRSRRLSGEKPPNTTEWIAPMRAQASMA